MYLTYTTKIASYSYTNKDCIPYQNSIMRFIHILNEIMTQWREYTHMQDGYLI